MHTRPTSIATAFAVGCLVLAACGGDDATPAVTDPPPATDRATTATPDAAPDAAPATGAATTGPAETDPPATTRSPAPTTTAPVSFDLATLPELIERSLLATTDATIAPLEIARRLLGFPYDIPVPEGSTLYEASVDPGFYDDGDHFSFSYLAVAPGGVVPDIDITLDDNGPGSVQIIEIWDPIMAGLGFGRQNSTASDPGEPGGPNSINHVYTTPEPQGIFNGVPGEVQPVFVWSTEDLNGWSYRSEVEMLAGYQVDVAIATAPGAGVPIPIVAGLLELMPVPEGLALSDADVDLRRRSPDSYDADLGLVYLSVFLEWEAAPGALGALLDFYGDPAGVFADEALLMAGEDDFFDPGTIVRTEWTEYGSTGHRLGLLLLQRYGATLGIEAGSDPSAPIRISLQVQIDPAAGPLTPPPG